MTAVFKYLKGCHTEGGLEMFCMPTRRQISTQLKKELPNSQDFYRPLRWEVVRALSMKADRCWSTLDGMAEEPQPSS